MNWALIPDWWRRRRRSARGERTDDSAGERAEQAAARRRILDEAARQRGRPEGRHRWYDGGTRRLTEQLDVPV